MAERKRRDDINARQAGSQVLDIRTQKEGALFIYLSVCLSIFLSINMFSLGVCVCSLYRHRKVLCQSKRMIDEEVKETLIHGHLYYLASQAHKRHSK